ncbi:MAG: protein kinase [Eubacterium sp.]|nr:protein kinase [Eubacterium sp.]
MMRISRDKSDNSIFAAKIIRNISVDIYSRLKESQLTGIPGIIEIIQGDEHAIVVEQFIDGQNLGEMIEEDRNYLKHVDSIDHIVSEILNVIEMLSELDPPIIHRDIKPDNIMIDKDKKIYLVDFSISRELDGEKVRDTVAMGTRGFAAPEQYGFSESDIRTDFYGLGATVKYILDNVDIDRSYLPDNERLKLIEDFSAKCMMIDKKDRFQSVGEIRRFLGIKENERKKGVKKDKSAVVNKISAVNKNAQDVNDINKKYSYVPPGFRTQRPEKMMLGTVGYILAAVFSITVGFLDKEDYYEVSKLGVLFLNVLTSILTFGVICIVIFFLFNYRGMRDSFPFVRDMKTRKGKIICSIFMSILIFIVLFFSEGMLVITLTDAMK